MTDKETKVHRNLEIVVDISIEDVENVDEFLKGYVRALYDFDLIKDVIDVDRDGSRLIIRGWIDGGT